MPPLWTLVDDTKKGAGYLRICKSGIRVADVFPYAKEADEQWVRERAHEIVNSMNAENEACIDFSQGLPPIEELEGASRLKRP